MEGYLTIIAGIGVWHLAALNSLSMANGLPGILAPRWVILSRFHLLGMLCAITAVASVILGMRTGFLALGCVVGGGLGCLDSYLIYRAVNVNRPR